MKINQTRKDKLILKQQIIIRTEKGVWKFGLAESQDVNMATMLNTKIF